MVELKLNKKEIKFITKFFILFLIGTTFLYFANIEFFNNELASFIGTNSGLKFKNNSLFSQNTKFIITNECNGFFSVIILGSIIYSLKKPNFKKKTTLFLAGSLFIIPLNIIRLYFVILGNEILGFQIANTLHVFSWFLTPIIVLMFWYFLTKKSLKLNEFSQLL